MCLIVFSYQQYPSHPLILLANRDEFYNRPSLPVHTWDNNTRITAGKDLTHGGIWLGYNRHGQWGAITNYRANHLYDGKKKSRGDILRLYLEKKITAQQYMNSLLSQLHYYNHFNLIIGDNHGAWYISSVNDTSIQLSAGLYGLSNGVLDEPWPKVSCLKSRFANHLDDFFTIDSNSYNLSNLNKKDLFYLMSDTSQPPLEHCPKTGLTDEKERALASIFIHSEHYGTVNTSLLYIDENLQYSLTEKCFNNHVIF